MMILITSLCCAIWFNWELKRFPLKINRLVFQNMESLMPLPFDLAYLLSHSTLQIKYTSARKYLFFVLPIFGLLLNNFSLTFITIGFILIYLSFLDCFYYLTDSKYVALVFILSLINLLFFHSQNQQPYLFSLIFTALFLNLFAIITTFLFKKEAFGMGDVILLIALSPLFTLEQMLLLLFIASLSGLFIASGYFLLKKQKLIKLPFIPFISFSTFIMWFIII